MNDDPLQMQEQDLFPPASVRRSGYLRVDQLHELYWEETGAENAPVVVFLHGGPGAGCAPIHRRFFDPAAWRIILFDQRGAGRSRPGGAVTRNTTQHLVDDLERLREALGIERWMLFGGSWGSALALAYAQQWPDRVTGCVLRGIFLGTRGEVEWFFNGMSAVFPEPARDLREALPEAEDGNVLEAYGQALMNPNPQIHLPAAAAWTRYEAACATMQPPTVPAFRQVGASTLALARIEAHYFRNDMFLQPGELLDGMAKIEHIPAVLVQGRFDMICPMRGADALARAWPAARLEIVADGAHSALEPAMRKRLVAATMWMRAQLLD